MSFTILNSLQKSTIVQSKFSAICFKNTNTVTNLIVRSFSINLSAYLDHSLFFGCRRYGFFLWRGFVLLHYGLQSGRSFSALGDNFCRWKPARGSGTASASGGPGWCRRLSGGLPRRSAGGPGLASGWLWLLWFWILAVILAVWLVRPLTWFRCWKVKKYIFQSYFQMSMCVCK